MPQSWVKVLAHVQGLSIKITLGIMRAAHESLSGQQDSARHDLGTIHDIELCDENDEQRTRELFGRTLCQSLDDATALGM